MAIVTDYLLQLIAKQVDEQGLVVWYDPEEPTVRSLRNCTCRTRRSPGMTAASSNCEPRSTTC